MAMVTAGGPSRRGELEWSWPEREDVAMVVVNGGVDTSEGKKTRVQDSKKRKGEEAVRGRGGGGEEWLCHNEWMV